MRVIRVYVDTSVFGGAFDDAFSVGSQRFFDEVRAGKYKIVFSMITAGELDQAPTQVRRLVSDLPPGSVERLVFTREMADLRDAYLEAGVVGVRWIDDAAHVAAATVARADLLISWNFRHLVQWERTRAFNSVNLRLGYPVMTILSPAEVITGEEEN